MLLMLRVWAVFRGLVLLRWIPFFFYLPSISGLDTANTAPTRSNFGLCSADATSTGTFGLRIL